MEYDNKSRQYFVHFPTGYTKDESYPLIMALHGGFGKAKDMEEYTGLSQKADEEGFMVVYPQGFLRSWNAGECCGAAHKRGIDDAGFLASLADSLAHNYAVDKKRVFATGLSNGGFMTFKLLCDQPETFRAIAPVEASMVTKSCTPSQPGSIVQFHSYRDDYVPYQGGSGEGPSDVYKPPVDSVLGVWADISGCNPQKVTVGVKPDYEKFAWKGCSSNTKIQLYVTNDGGHSWPGGTLTFPDSPSKAVDATDVMWNFFKDVSGD